MLPVSTTSFVGRGGKAGAFFATVALLAAVWWRARLSAALLQSSRLRWLRVLLGSGIKRTDDFYEARRLTRNAARRERHKPKQHRPSQAERIKAAEAERERQAHALPVILIDCAFSAGSTPKVHRSIGKQISCCLGANRNAARPAKLHICGATGSLRDVLKQMGSDSWMAQQSELRPHELFAAGEPADKLVVLSPDSPNVLLEIDASKIYCIGGIVDRTPQRNMTLNYASQHDLMTARLPTGPELPQNNILNINTVFEALVNTPLAPPPRQNITE